LKLSVHCTSAAVNISAFHLLFQEFNTAGRKCPRPRWGTFVFLWHILNHKTM